MAILGSAIVAQVTAQVAPLARYRPGTAETRPPRRSRTMSWRATRDGRRSRRRPYGSGARERVRAGQHFERLLAAHGAARYIAAYRTAYPLPEAAAVVNRRARAYAPALHPPAGVRVIAGDRLTAALTATSRPSGARASRAARSRRSPLPTSNASVPRPTTWLAWSDSLVTSPADRKRRGFPIAWSTRSGRSRRPEARP